MKEEQEEITQKLKTARNGSGPTTNTNNAETLTRTSPKRYWFLSFFSKNEVQLTPEQEAQYEKEKRKQQDSLEKLGQWLLFTIAVGLLPLILDAIREATKTDPAQLGWIQIYTILEHGELDLICAAVTAEAMGHIFLSANRKGCLGLLVFSFSCFIFFLSAGVYVIAKIKADGITNPSDDVLVLLAKMSLALYAGTVLAGGSCKLLAVKMEETLEPA